MAEQEIERKTIPFEGPSTREELLKHAYYGSGGFEDGSFIFPHVRETTGKYLRRKQMAYYTNYLGPIVRGIVAPIFRKEAKREWTSTDGLFSGFMEDVDNGKHSMKKFMRKATQLAKLYGAAFIVVDNVPDVPDNLEAAKELRAFPYCYIVLPQDVKEYEVTKSGRITSFKYEVHAYKYSTGGKTKVTETWTWTEQTWRKEGGDLEEPVEKDHGLGCVPIVPLFGTDVEDSDIMPTSECVQMAKVNLAIFNICSELRELLRNQCFSVLAYPFTEALSPEQLKEMIVGTEDMLPFDGNKNPPEFISPGADCATTLQNELERLVNEIYRMAAMASVTGVQTETSGVAKAWDFEQTNQTISDLADNCQDAELRIAYLFGQWQNGDVGYTCAYPDDFGIVDLKSELDIITEALSLAVGGMFDQELKKKATALLFTDLDEADYDSIIKDIEQMTESIVQNRAYELDAEQARLKATIDDPTGEKAAAAAAAAKAKAAGA